MAEMPDDIGLEMGDWVAFHDEEVPLLARLVMHDRASDSFIFVNRDGAKIRELNRLEILRLIAAQELVSIERYQSNS